MISRQKVSYAWDDDWVVIAGGGPNVAVQFYPVKMPRRQVISPPGHLMTRELEPV